MSTRFWTRRAKEATTPAHNDARTVISRSPAHKTNARAEGAVRAIVAGWFSFQEGAATAGDLIARDLVCEWLEMMGHAYDVAVVPPFPGDVDWRLVNPSDYSHAIFVCGPFGDGAWEREFVERFSGAKLIGIDLSMLLPTTEWNPFSTLIERDSTERANPDLVWGTKRRLPPVVGICLVEDYPQGLTSVTNEAIKNLVKARKLSLVPIDTRLETNATGLRSAAEVEALVARMDAVITTRLHGMVMALKNGVPALVIDPEAGGAKILKQARLVGWPQVFTVDNMDPGALENALDYCLTDTAKELALKCYGRAVDDLAGVQEEFMEALSPNSQPPSNVDPARRHKSDLPMFDWNLPYDG